MRGRLETSSTEQRIVDADVDYLLGARIGRPKLFGLAGSATMDFLYDLEGLAPKPFTSGSALGELLGRMMQVVSGRERCR